MKKNLITICLLITACSFSFGRNVMTWVPVYGISNCKSLLNSSDKSVWFKNGLTHIGLQFWVPGDNGAVTFITDYQYTGKAATIGQDVTDFVTWGNTNNVKVMLCLYNVRSNDFDWAIAKKAFSEKPNESVASIMTIINNYGLDGVDIDFEGVGNYASDKNAYVSFLDTLGKALHASGKQLSMDMFSTPCYNAPNPSWESALAPHVDFMNIMGYDETYEDNDQVFSYCPQTPSEAGAYAFKYSYIEEYLTETQGVASSKLNYGLPSWSANWGGQCAHENILDIMAVSTAGGIAIWDLQLEGNGVWKEAVTWDLIAMFKNDSTSSEIRKAMLICGQVTATQDKITSNPDFFYDYYNHVVNLSGMEGDLYLYSAIGVAERSWKVKAGENISLEGIDRGFYILKFQTKSGTYNRSICVGE